MDDYMFNDNVSRCKTVVEDTQYLEIFNYSVSGLNLPLRGLNC